MKGQHEPAIENFGKAIRFDPPPRNGMAYSNRAFNYALLGRWLQAERDATTAIEYLDEMIQDSPRIADAHGARGYANTVLGRDSEAQQDFDRAVQLGTARSYIEDQLDHLRRHRSSSDS